MLNRCELIRYRPIKGADLPEANLKGVNSSEANLSYASLWGVNLKGTILEKR